MALTKIQSVGKFVWHLLSNILSIYYHLLKFICGVNLLHFQVNCVANLCLRIEKRNHYMYRNERKQKRNKNKVERSVQEIGN